MKVTLRKKETTPVSLFASLLPKTFVDTATVGVHQATHTVGTARLLQHNTGVTTQIALTVCDFLVNNGFAFGFVLLLRT